MSLCALWLRFKTGFYHNRLNFLVGLLENKDEKDNDQILSKKDETTDAPVDSE